VNRNFIGVHIEQDDEQQDPGEGRGVPVGQPVAPEEPVVVEPDPEQDREADREGEEAAQHVQQLVEGLRDLEGDHQQRDREGEDGVGQALQPGDVAPAPAEPVVGPEPLVLQSPSHPPMMMPTGP
jgi:hypothetical protein